MKIKTNLQIFISKKWLLYSLSIALIGIFLLPQIARLSGISEENIILETNQVRARYDLPSLTANQLLTFSEEEVEATFGGSALVRSRKRSDSHFWPRYERSHSLYLAIRAANRKEFTVSWVPQTVTHVYASFDGRCRSCD